MNLGEHPGLQRYHGRERGDETYPAKISMSNSLRVQIGEATSNFFDLHHEMSVV